MILNVTVPDDFHDLWAEANLEAWQESGMEKEPFNIWLIQSWIRQQYKDIKLSKETKIQVDQIRTEINDRIMPDVEMITIEEQPE